MSKSTTKNHFLINKYSKWYFNIIKNAQKRDMNDYLEIHHIIPKSIGGTNDIINLVKLTYKEHFICHWLLIKMVKRKKDKKKMSFALWTMTRINKNQQNKRIISSGQYNVARKNFIDTQKGKTHSEETKRKISESHKKTKKPWGAYNITHNKVLTTKIWEVQIPTGEIIVIENLAKFCREQNLSHPSLSHTGKSKGYKLIKCLGKGTGRRGKIKQNR